MSKWSFAGAGGRSGQPLWKVAFDFESAFVVQRQCLMSAHGREPKFVILFFELNQNSSTDPCGVAQTPQPDMRIEKEFQSRKTSHSSSSVAGEIMSPVIFIVPFIDPIQAARSSTAVGG